MDYQEVIIEALRRVVSEHGYLGVVRNRNIHEQALSHRLAHHLENSGLFVGYHVDCEYNRHGENPKTDTEGNTFRPDIIIHVRGNDEGNLIMIESKKFNDPATEIRETFRNLRNRKTEYAYQHALLVIFPENTVNNECVIEV